MTREPQNVIFATNDVELAAPELVKFLLIGGQNSLLRLDLDDSRLLDAPFAAAGAGHLPADHDVREAFADGARDRDRQAHLPEDLHELGLIGINSLRHLQ